MFLSGALFSAGQYCSSTCPTPSVSPYLLKQSYDSTLFPRTPAVQQNNVVTNMCAFFRLIYIEGRDVVSTTTVTRCAGISYEYYFALATPPGASRRRTL